MRNIVCVLTVMTLLGWGTVAQAQMQPTGTPQGQTAAGPRPPAQRQPRHTIGEPGMMEMMCPMMMGMMMGQGGMARGTMGPGMMGPGMSGMSGMGNPMDPKTMARMLRLRGDMMKAISEVLLKHAQELEQEK